jgi:CheY-like chemotaxis protein
MVGMQSKRERRQDIRVAANGSVLLHARRSVRGRAIDVSTGGIRVQITDDDPPCAPGEAVRLQLRLDGAATRWLHFDGEVRRAGRRGTLAVAFTAVPRDFAAMLVAEVAAEAARARRGHVLLVDGVASRRAALAAALRVAGCHVAEASTPLDTLACLGESTHHFWLVAIADTVPGAVVDELRAFLADVDPRIQVVLLAELVLADGTGAARPADTAARAIVARRAAP